MAKQTSLQLLIMKKKTAEKEEQQMSSIKFEMGKEVKKKQAVKSGHHSLSYTV